MRAFDERFSVEGAAKEMHRRAMKWVYDGDKANHNKRHMTDCRAVHKPTKTVVTFGRTSGHHSKGGYRSPATERCFQLSLSFVDFEAQTPLEARSDLLEQWLVAFFGEELEFVWVEAPVSAGWFEQTFRWAMGLGTGDLLFWHFRKFCDESWETVKEEPREMIKDLRGRGWVRATELKLRGEKIPRRPFWISRVWRRLTLA